jgi:hypothetical protein
MAHESYIPFDLRYAIETAVDRQWCAHVVRSLG